MTYQTRERLDYGFTWFWRALVVALLTSTLATAGWFGAKTVDTFIGMARDINQIKNSIGTQTLINANQTETNRTINYRLTNLENQKQQNNFSNSKQNSN